MKPISCLIDSARARSRSTGDAPARAELHRAARIAACLAGIALAGLAGTISLGLLGAGTAQARTARGASSLRSGVSQGARSTCLIRSLPKFIDQGEEALTATVADVVEVECDPDIYGTGSKVRITANQLYTLCGTHITWYVPNPFRSETGRGVTVELDADGNATVALRAGPGCSAGETLIAAHLEEEPFETFTTSFSVEPPEPTPEGVFAMPATQVEDAESSAAATIIETEFTNGSEKPVHISAEELYHRCRIAPHLHWILMNGEVLSETAEISGVRLDNDGNAFVIAIGDRSCAPGGSLIEADLEARPFSTNVTEFTIDPPQPTGQPVFTIEKLQEVAGSGSGFTASPLKAALGRTVDYEVVVTNTGHLPVTLEEFSDLHCDAGTIAGGPGSLALGPGQSTTWTCAHALSAAGTYTNEATVTGSAVGGTPVSETSNQVLVEVPREPALAIEKLQEIAGSGFTKSVLTGAVGEDVKYEIIVKNTGNEPLELASFTDTACDAGTIAGGPGEALLAPQASTTYTCNHVLTGPGTYVNVAEVVGTPPGEESLPRLASNKVEVVVPSKPGPSVLPGKTEVAPSKEGHHGVEHCEVAQPALHGAAGSRRGPFNVDVRAAGIKSITFYLDKRKLKTLSQSQAKHGQFTVEIDPRKLSYGAHTVSIKTRMSETSCAPIARSAVFAHAHSPVVVPHPAG